MNNLTEQSKHYTWGLSPPRWKAREPSQFLESCWISGMLRIVLPRGGTVQTMLTKFFGSVPWRHFRVLVMIPGRESFCGLSSPSGQQVAFRESPVASPGLQGVWQSLWRRSSCCVGIITVALQAAGRIPALWALQQFNVLHITAW